MQPRPIASQTHVGASGGRELEAFVITARLFGWIQTVIGILTIVLGSLITSVLGYSESCFNLAIWTGIWVIIGGILSKSSAANPSNTCLHKTNMAYTLFTAFIMCFQFYICLMAFSVMKHYAYNCDMQNNCSYTTNTTGLAMYGCLLALTILEFILTLSVIALRDLCRCRCCYKETRVVNQQSNATSSSALVQSSVHTSYQSCRPAASSQNAFGSLAPPPYSSHQEDTSTNDDNAALA